MSYIISAGGGGTSDTETLTVIASNSQTINANNTTVALPLWTITGVIAIYGLFGVVTTALSSNITAAYWRLNDGTTQTSISLATGTILSNYRVNSLLYRTSAASSALSATNANSAAASIVNGANVEWSLLNAGTLTAKSGNTCNIEFVYSTTNTPASGAITFYLRYKALSGVLGGTVVAV